MTSRQIKALNSSYCRRCGLGSAIRHLTNTRRSPNPPRGPTTELLADKAREHQLHIIESVYADVGGGGCENLTPVIGPDGEVIGSYTKTHLFDAPDRVDIQSGIRESDKVRPENDLPVFETSLGPLGISVCSDLRFPEVYRVLVLRGAKVIVCASAFLSPRLDHWDPWVTVIATASDVEGVVTSQLDLDLIDVMQQRYPLMHQRRPELYGPITATI